MVLGMTRLTLGTVPALSQTTVAMTLLAVVGGMHEVKGISVVDLGSGVEYPLTKRVVVMAKQQPGGDGEGAGA